MSEKKQPNPRETTVGLAILKFVPLVIFALLVI